MPLLITRGIGGAGSGPTPAPASSVSPANANTLNSSGDFGSDISCFNDLDPSLSLVSGLALLGQEVLHRLITTRGSLQYDPDYGYDTRQLLNASVGPSWAAQQQANIQSEVLKIEKIQQCAVILDFNQLARRLNITINGITSQGPFRLVLGVDQLTAELLNFTAST